MKLLTSTLVVLAGTVAALPGGRSLARRNTEVDISTYKDKATFAQSQANIHAAQVANALLNIGVEQGNIDDNNNEIEAWTKKKEANEKAVEEFEEQESAKQTYEEHKANREGLLATLQAGHAFDKLTLEGEQENIINTHQAKLNQESADHSARRVPLVTAEGDALTNLKSAQSNLGYYTGLEKTANRAIAENEGLIDELQPRIAEHEAIVAAKQALHDTAVKNLADEDARWTEFQRVHAEDKATLQEGHAADLAAQAASHQGIVDQWNIDRNAEEKGHNDNWKEEYDQWIAQKAHTDSLYVD